MRSRDQRRGLAREFELACEFMPWVSSHERSSEGAGRRGAGLSAVSAPCIVHTAWHAQRHLMRRFWRAFLRAGCLRYAGDRVVHVRQRARLGALRVAAPPGRHVGRPPHLTRGLGALHDNRDTAVATPRLRRALVGEGAGAVQQPCFAAGNCRPTRSTPADTKASLSA
jgi:hypothetical protein